MPESSTPSLLISGKPRPIGTINTKKKKADISNKHNDFSSSSTWVWFILAVEATHHVLQSSVQRLQRLINPPATEDLRDSQPSLAERLFSMGQPISIVCDLLSAFSAPSTIKHGNGKFQIESQTTLFWVGNSSTCIKSARFDCPKPSSPFGVRSVFSGENWTADSISTSIASDDIIVPFRPIEALRTKTILSLVGELCPTPSSST